MNRDQQKILPENVRFYTNNPGPFDWLVDKWGAFLSNEMPVLTTIPGEIS